MIIIIMIITIIILIITMIITIHNHVLYCPSPWRFPLSESTPEIDTGLKAVCNLYKILEIQTKIANDYTLFPLHPPLRNVDFCLSSPRPQRRGPRTRAPDNRFRQMQDQLNSHQRHQFTQFLGLGSGGSYSIGGNIK